MYIDIEEPTEDRGLFLVIINVKQSCLFGPVDSGWIITITPLSERTVAAYF